MSKKSIVASVFAVLVLVAGIYAGVQLVKQRQNLQEQAAVPGGQARVSLFPTSGSFKVGDSLPVSVYFNTSGVSVSSVKLRLVYPFTGTAPEVTASNIQINQVIESSGDWNCPTKSVTTEGQNVAIDIACANIGASGYSTTSDTLLATFNLTVNQIPQSNPFSLRFDPSQSIITQKSNGQDILNIPDPSTAVGTFTVTNDQGSPAPTSPPSTTTTAPTATPSPTKTPTPTQTVKPTSTPTGTIAPTTTLKPTATPTSSANLPVSGNSTPTYIGLGLGLILIIASVILAL